MEEIVKKKRGRPRKNPLPETIQTKIQEIVDLQQEQEDNEIHALVEDLRIESRKGLWDVDKDMIYRGKKIFYFDKRLSYEATGYKPITETEGLDFKPEWFTEVRDTKTKTGHYTSYHRGTKLYRDFQRREWERCKNGMTSHGYTITGTHYFFLNYYQLPNPETEKAGTSRLEIFPNFYSYQYEFFHYYELCRYLRKNCGLMKSRGIGFSEINAALLANMFSVYRGSNTLLTAFTDNYVKVSLQKVWNELSFLNDETDGLFTKLTQVVNQATKKRASHWKKNSNGQDVEDGFMSQVEGIVADKDSKIRGNRTDLIILEEAGSNPIFTKSFVKAEALTTLGGNKIGIIMAGGTGGDTGPAMAGLKDLYYDPMSVDVLPFYHNYTPTEEWIYSAFFIPAYTALYKKAFVDDRGVCIQKLAKAYYEEEFKKREGTPKKLVDYKAEFCFTADDAFNLEGTNKFNKVLLVDRLAKLQVAKETSPVIRGDLQFVYKGGKDQDLKNIVGVRWIEDPNGPIYVSEKPIWEEEHTEINDQGKEIIVTYKEMSNLYVAGIDGIDIGQEQTSEYTRDPSKFCIAIKKRAFGLQQAQYVAYYMERPLDVRQAYKEALKLMMWYNCKANIEATRLNMLGWARDNGFTQFFMNRPKATYPDFNQKVRATIGTPATQAIISHQTDLIAAFIEDNIDTFWFTEMLQQLISYTDENKGKFDIVAAMAMAELADEELTGRTPVEIEQNPSSTWVDIGYYTDERGYKKFGPIPKKKQYPTNFNINRIDNDPRRIRTSNPRFNSESIL